jgi:hypothetical protein
VHRSEIVCMTAHTVRCRIRVWNADLSDSSTKLLHNAKIDGALIFKKHVLKYVEVKGHHCPQ